MGLYWDILFPRLCDWALGQPHFARYRRQLLAGVAGEILEIGIGTGLNLPHYPAQVRRITAVDPSPGMSRLLQKRVARTDIEVDHRMLGGDSLPFADESFDCVVSTWTLCSVRAAERAVAELFRVLRHDGQFLFLEHGLDDDPKVQRWQRRLNWLQLRLAACRLDQNVRELVGTQPFRAIEIDNFYADRTPKTHGYMYRGVARK